MAKAPTLFWYCLLFIILLCLILLIYFGVTLVHPFQMTSGYAEADCSAVNMTQHGLTKCTCYNGEEDESCYSAYPCVEITVRISPRYKSISLHEARLFKHFTADYNTQLCALQPCEESQYLNKLNVGKFVASYGNRNRSDAYTCLYNPNNMNQVILERPNRTSVAMAMLFPSLIILVCLVLLIVTCCSACIKSRYY